MASDKDLSTETQTKDEEADEMDDLPVPPLPSDSGCEDDLPSPPVPDNYGYIDDELPTPPVPPDGGWGWMVVLASFLVNVIVDGVCFSFGVFYIAFLDAFGASKAKTAWVGSLIPGMYLGMGPLVSALANKFGCRSVTMVGSVIASASFFLSTFSTNINMLIVTYGIMGGIGFGLMYLPSIVIVGYYFDKKRALATGLAVCGTGIGTFIFAPLGGFLLSEYGWQGGNWIISAIILHGIPCGAVFRSLETKPKKKKKKIKMHNENNNGTITQSAIIQKTIALKERNRTISTGSLDGTVITKDNKLIKDPQVIQYIKNMMPPKNVIVCNGLPELPEDFPAKKQLSGTSAPTESPLQDQFTDDTRPETDKTDLLEPPPFFTSVPINKRLLELKGANANNSPRQRKRCNTYAGPTRPDLGGSTESWKSREEIHEYNKKQAARPMYRKDIFYAGSVRNIPEYKSTSSMASYVQSITSIPKTPAENSLYARCLPLITVLKDMFDLSLFKSVTFIILCMGSVFAMIGFFTPFVFITDHALRMGVPAAPALFLLSILGIANTIGRVIAGWVSDRPWADCLLIHNIALIISGAATCFVPFLKSYALLASYCVLFGLCIAAFIALRSIVLVDLLGVDKLTNSFGLLLLCQGVASLLGSPLAGFLFDAFDSYLLSFIISGALIALAGFICLPIRVVARWENARSKRHRGDIENLTEYTRVLHVENQTGPEVRFEGQG